MAQRPVSALKFLSGGFANNTPARLEALLLRLGGGSVAAGSFEPQQLVRLMMVGRPFRERPTVIDVPCAALVRDNAKKLWMVTGYALTRTGTWVQHEWAIGNGSVYDRQRHVAYFGAPIGALSLKIRLRAEPQLSVST